MDGERISRHARLQEMVARYRVFTQHLLHRHTRKRVIVQQA